MIYVSDIHLTKYVALQRDTENVKSHDQNAVVHENFHNAFNRAFTEYKSIWTVQLTKSCKNC